MIPVCSLLLLSGCSLLGLDDDVRDRLDAERRDWAALEIHDYDITLRLSCFCPESMIQPFVATVRSDSLVSITAVATGDTLPRFQPSTVADLFEVIERAISDDADDLEVVYDADYHYPTHISFHHENALDSGMRVEVLSFIAHF